MDDGNIRVYVYTAVDGYAWQGCDAHLADSLQRCMEATGTLSGGGGREPPWGGVIRCSLLGEPGNALYRYHRREAGDFRGRDSQYLALAFLPLSRSGAADFARVFEAEPMRAPVRDGFADLAIRGDDARLSEAAFAEELAAFSDDPAKPFARTLEGAGLFRKLSALFQNSTLQLGGLSCVLRESSGGALRAEVRYEVFPEVAEEAAARDAFERAWTGPSGPEDVRTALAAWRGAAEALSGKAARIPGFQGLSLLATAAVEDCRERAALFSRSEALLDALLRQKAAIDAFRVRCDWTADRSGIVGDPLAAETANAGRIEASVRGLLREWKEGEPWPACFAAGLRSGAEGLSETAIRLFDRLHRLRDLLRPLAAGNRGSFSSRRRALLSRLDSDPAWAGVSELAPGLSSWLRANLSDVRSGRISIVEADSGSASRPFSDDRRARRLRAGLRWSLAGNLLLLFALLALALLHVGAFSSDPEASDDVRSDRPSDEMSAGETNAPPRSATAPPGRGGKSFGGRFSCSAAKRLDRSGGKGDGADGPLSGAEDEVAELREKVERLESQDKEREAEREKATGERDDLWRKNQALAKGMTSIEAERARLEDRNGELEKARNREAEEKERLQETVKTLEREKEALRQAVEKTKNNALATLADHRKAKEAEIERLNRQIGLLRSEKGALADKISELEKEKSRLEESKRALAEKLSKAEEAAARRRSEEEEARRKAAASLSAEAEEAFARIRSDEFNSGWKFDKQRKYISDCEEKVSGLVPRDNKDEWPLDPMLAAARKRVLDALDSAASADRKHRDDEARVRHAEAWKELRDYAQAAEDRLRAAASAADGAPGRDDSAPAGGKGR